MKHSEFLAKGKELFGASPREWRFKCPSCGDVADGNDFQEALEGNPRERADGSELMASDLLGQECIGRTLGALRKGDEPYTGRGCDWTAYGLFRGPVHVVAEDGREMWCFEFAEEVAS